MTANRTPPETEAAHTAMDPVSPIHAPLSDDHSAARRRRVIAAGASILINLLLVVAILITLPPPPTLVPQPIPVKVVPPSAVPKPAAQKPRPKTPTPPKEQASKAKPKPKPHPQLRRASADLGDPKAPDTARLASQAPPAGPAQAQEGSDEATTKGDAAAQEASKPDAEAKLGTVKPKPIKVRRASAHVGGSRVQAVMEPPHNSQHHAKYPGPDATRNAYLAYVQEEVEGCITPEIVAGIQAVGHPPELSIALRRNGTILWINILRSTGSSAVDRAFLTIFDCIGRFPPVPEDIGGAPVVLTYGDLHDTP